MMPRDENGRFVTLACPVKNCGGKLVYQGSRTWECDGLIDPDDPNKEPEACGFDHIDGLEYLPHRNPCRAPTPSAPAGKETR